MKTYLITAFTLLLSIGNAYSQCEGFSQKIASPVCTKPTDAKVISTSCTKLVVQWKGGNAQNFEVTATLKDISTNEATTITVSDITCDANNNWKATIPVIEGTKVSWGVQSICLIDDRTFYSYQLRGKEVAIPNCKSEQENFSKSITNVYPNPSTGNITVEYLSNSSGNVQFSIYDVNGKVLFTQAEKPEQGISATFEFHLADLMPGIYLLEARNGMEVSSKKFVLLR